MNTNIKVTVSKHTWLDYSVSWFVYINGIKSGGECTTEKEAIEIADGLAKNLNGTYEGKNETNELFS